MAKKKGNRKKALRKQLAALRKAGHDLAGAAVHKTQEVLETVAEATGQVVEKVSEKVEETVENLSHKSQKAAADGQEEAEKAVKDVAEQGQEVVKETKEKAQEAVASLEEFSAELEGVASSRLETFYEAGIESKEDFADWTQSQLLELKGIGPATIKQLKELGVSLKD